jgi:putative endonuclease
MVGCLLTAKRLTECHQQHSTPDSRADYIAVKEYYVYIMTNKYGSSLYTGVTSDIARRIQEHRCADKTTFTGRYRLTRLVYVETTGDVWEALAREKQIKGWRRDKKIALIAARNPKWEEIEPI